MNGEAPKPAAFRGSGPFLRTAPPLWLPLRHFALASAALLVFAGGVAWRGGDLVGFDFNARFALGLVHVLTLGWVAQTILGAWCQMLPTHGETPLAFPRIATAGWWLFALGAAAYVGALWGGIERYWVPVSAAAAGLALELFALAATHARARKRDETWLHFAAALGWLAALATAGVLLAYDRERGLLFGDPEGALIAHVHMALIGFVATAIYGAGRRLIPWVALSQVRGRWAGRASFALTQLGLAGLALDALFFGRRLMPLWALLIAAGFVLYALQLGPLFGGGASFEPSLALTLLSFAGGVLWAALGLGLAFGRFADAAPARAAYVWAALVGCVTPMILAQVHKIAPFLVWLHVYSPRDWTPPVKVPKIDDLTSRGLAWAEFFALAVAAPLGTAGLWLERGGLVRAAGFCLSAAAAGYAWNLGLALRHVVRPDGRWTLPTVHAGE
ncbi:MAG: hypothetical protein HKL90_07690 [Elusimicrobia bacterium]|nr:hypothetical protein [Elusimicrobiota bacterium]